MQRFRDMPLESELDLVQAIERHLQHLAPYPDWTIGIARNPDRRCDQLQSPPFWCHWEAADEELARKTKRYFIEKGMKEDAEADRGRFIYIC
jgi:hypothetical protein